MRPLRSFLRSVLLGAGLVVAGIGLRAQMLDEVDVQRIGADAVVQVRMARPVRIQRTVAPSDSELTIVNYTIQGSDPDAATLAVTGDRRLVGRGTLPSIFVTDEAQGGRNIRERKLLVRVVPAARVQARAGRDGRTIELVLRGFGDKVGPALPITAASRPPAAGERFQILLHSTNDPNMQLPAAVPKSVQDYGLSTGQRLRGSETVYEFYLGPFATQAEAERTLALVQPRFPGATVVDTGAQPLPGAAQAVATVDPEAAAVPLMASAREARSRGDTAAAIEALGKLLDLPPNKASREAQEMVGELWQLRGDAERARREFELFLKLYPSGADSQRVAARLAGLPPPPLAAAEARAPRARPTTSALNGSIGTYFYGGQSKIRSEEFRDSGLGSLPELVQNPTISGTDQQLLMTNVDLNYRYRSPEHDLRFVFRDNHQANLMDSARNRNRLSALYVDYRSLTNGMSVKLGRQSPSGGGVMSRFDGILAGYAFAPKWKANVVAGKPADRLLQTRRHFYGASLDADALTEHVGGSVYVNQQLIDGYVDRKAVGLDLRYFNEGVFVSSNFDYDLEMRALNIAAVQGMWQQIDKDGNAGTTVNVVFDRRAQPLVTLGNALFFQDPSGLMIPVRMSDALQLRDIDTLRSYVRGTTAYSTQGLLSVTKPLSSHWQIGGDIRLTRIDAIPAVPDILPLGLPATGNIWGLGGQLIGTNLYSERDTHVLALSVQRSPSFDGVLAAYNNISVFDGGWQVEPNIQLYRQTSSIDGMKLSRIKPGVRVSWRFVPDAVVEGSLDYEITRISSPTRNENTDRIFYYLGGRYEF